MYTFTKLHDRRIPNVGVRVGVGPVEFQLNGCWGQSPQRDPGAEPMVKESGDTLKLIAFVVILYSNILFKKLVAFLF